MKALSIKQPYAWLICVGYKDIENRDWRIGRKPALGGTFKDRGLELPARVYVHAGKTPDAMWPAMDLIKRLHGESDSAIIWKNFVHYTVSAGQSIVFPSANKSLIIGEVDITGCVTESNSPWFVGKYGFTLANPKLYDKPIPYRGQLGFFEVTLPNTQEVKS